ncbi:MULTISPECIES: hypothetical protein [Haloferax]|uniref:DUF8101 domain-containing protein n=1 Tax=Haloferax marinum TaxID=2666143 RepID=A0A6A8G4A2_9EURY|nr:MULTISPECIES: hypothetical protein [Haloferax]KAB1195991.1 hypothetical protein Hfx1150_00050 [Haloferax sp. CBA1150]MRW94966.1 hypothetical protein [Haloferax marinum]
MNDTSDLPVSVRDSLTAAFDDARDAVRRGDTETALERLASASRTVEHKVPPGPVFERLQHGIDAAERTAADEPVVASEYLRLLAELLEPSDDD